MKGYGLRAKGPPAKLRFPGKFSNRICILRAIGRQSGALRPSAFSAALTYDGGAGAVLQKRATAFLLHERKQANIHLQVMQD